MLRRASMQKHKSSASAPIESADASLPNQRLSPQGFLSICRQNHYDLVNEPMNVLPCGRSMPCRSPTWSKAPGGPRGRTHVHAGSMSSRVPGAECGGIALVARAIAGWAARAGATRRAEPTHGAHLLTALAAQSHPGALWSLQAAHAPAPCVQVHAQTADL